MIIKDVRNNNKVKAHAYIHSGKSYTFRLPNGEYQPFFYYGSGWNPKKIHGEVIGGFANGEVFSKDNPQLLDYNILSYTLQLTSQMSLVNDIVIIFVTNKKCAVEDHAPKNT